MLKTILIVGGAGYIGSHVSRHLSDKGYEVIVLDLKNRHELMPINIHYFEGDLGDRALLDKIFTTYIIDIVMNLATFTNINESIACPMAYYSNNVFKTNVLLEAMITHGVLRHIFSSSAAVYGDPVSNVMDEHHPCHPLTPYGSSKRMLEVILNDYDHAYGLKSVIFRYFNVSGFGDVDFLLEDDLPKNLIPLCMAAASSKNPTFNVFGSDYPTADGTCERDFIHVNDIASAHDLAIDYLALENTSTIINLGSGKKYSVNHIVASIRSIMGSSLIVNYVPRRQGDVVSVRCDIKAASRILGWRPCCSDIQSIIASIYNKHYKNENKII